ncbi:hypothetical protein [Halobacillus ihumii]|uniref:hypothetical protein n=1 Tax=Halobacillus ihumii TaxID=2686092 RepID=UPI0013D06C62|nr:hypothetical protein [Halobacillus ihumii]
MRREEELSFVSEDPKSYLSTQAKSLEKMLKDIELTEEEKERIVSDNSKKIVVDNGLSFLGPVGGVVSAILNWNDGINQEMAEAKKLVLLQQYFDKTNSLESSLGDLKDFLISPQGNTLFNKILRLLDDSPPDRELSDHLSTVLKNLVDNGDFEKLFEKHRYALSQIERLTPQALTIISDYRTWPPIKLGASMQFGPKVTSDFYSEFSQAYCREKGISDDVIFNRIQHSVIELQRLGLMEAFNTEQRETRCKLTFIGEDLLTYITF